MTTPHEFKIEPGDDGGSSGVAIVTIDGVATIVKSGDSLYVWSQKVGGGYAEAFAEAKAEIHALAAAVNRVKT